MVLSWLKKTGAPAVTIDTAAVPTDHRVYVIGDIHGRADLLDELAGAIERDLAHAPPKLETILLGDYIDRGRDSSRVIDRLQRGDFPTPMRFLRGNHEAMFLRFLTDPKELDRWRRYGGLETISSYEVSVSDAMRGTGYDKVRTDLQGRLPSEHLTFIEFTVLHWAIGDFFFCHAGVRQGVPLDAQREEDLLWIREEFLSNSRPYDKVIVHGHTPVPAPEFKQNRIGIDTGAFATGVLTCLVLEGHEKRLLQTKRE